MNTEAIWDFLETQGVDFGLKVLGALVLWLVGRWLIGWAHRLAHAALRRGRHIGGCLGGRS